jgi:hypothetical protein
MSETGNVPAELGAPARVREHAAAAATFLARVGVAVPSDHRYIHLDG